MEWSKKMKINNLIKASPFFFLLLLITLLSISNQKEYTKLKIIIWDTPSLKLGTYLAISSASGFILSYILNTNFANFIKSKPKKSLSYKKDSEYDENNQQDELFIDQSFDNTLIERDIKDPAPTMNAKFRIIGRTERGNKNYEENNNLNYNDSIESDEKYDEQPSRNETINQTSPIQYDWNDDSYSRW